MHSNCRKFNESINSDQNINKFRENTAFAKENDMKSHMPKNKILQPKI